MNILHIVKVALTLLAAAGMLTGCAGAAQRQYDEKHRMEILNAAQQTVCGQYCSVSHWNSTGGYRVDMKGWLKERTALGVKAQEKYEAESYTAIMMKLRLHTATPHEVANWRGRFPNDPRIANLTPAFVARVEEELNKDLLAEEYRKKQAVINEATAQEEANAEFTVFMEGIARQEAAQRKANKAAAQRAYDNSAQSLME